MCVAVNIYLVQEGFPSITAEPWLCISVAPSTVIIRIRDHALRERKPDSDGEECEHAQAGLSQTRTALVDDRRKGSLEVLRVLKANKLTSSYRCSSLAKFFFPQVLYRKVLPVETCLDAELLGIDMVRLLQP